MREGRGDRLCSLLLEIDGGLDQGAPRRDLIVDDDRVHTLHFTDEVSGLGLLGVVVAPFVDDGHREVQAVRVAPNLLSLSSVAGHKHSVTQVSLTEIIRKQRGRLEVIDGDSEEPSDLGGVEVHGDHPIRPSGLKEVRHQARRDGDTRLVLLVRANIGEIGDDGGDPACRRVLQGVHSDQELHDSAVDWRTRGLNNEDIGAADVLVDLDHQVLIGELNHFLLPKRDI